MQMSGKEGDADQWNAQSRVPCITQAAGCAYIGAPAEAEENAASEQSVRKVISFDFNFKATIGDECHR